MMFSILVLIFAYGFITSKNEKRSYLGMFRNIDNHEYVNSFLSQQPRITLYALQKAADGENRQSYDVYDRYIFPYGSWEFQPLNISQFMNETVIFLLKEKYVLNNEANKSFNNFIQEIQNNVSNVDNIDRLDYNQTDERLVCFNGKNSPIIKFYSSKFSQYLYIILRALRCSKFYENMFVKQADKFIGVIVEKNISINEAEFQYKFNENDSGEFDPKPRTVDDGSLAFKDVVILFAFVIFGQVIDLFFEIIKKVTKLYK